MSTCDGTRNIRAVPRRNQRHERLTKTVVTSPLRKSWPSKPNPIYTLEGLTPKAITATAHKLARLVYSLLQHGSAYVQQGLDAYEAQYRERKVTTMAKQAKALGYTLVPLAARG